MGARGKQEVKHLIAFQNEFVITNRLYLIPLSVNCSQKNGD